MQLLNRIIPVYQHYTNEYGLPGVRARTWHPGWFIPVWKYQIVYWLGFWQRYKNYQNTLIAINIVLNQKHSDAPDAITKIAEIIGDVDCGFVCGFTEPYGFVPEADCPIHDI